MKSGRHSNRYLQAAWTKYGAAAFVFEVLEHIDNKADLIVREQPGMDVLGAYGAGFNLRPVANSILGMKRSAETKAKIGAKHKGKTISPEHRARQVAAVTGRVATDEQRAKLSAAGKRRFQNPAVREKQAAHLKHIRSLRANFTISPEHRAKISERHRGERNHSAKITEDTVRLIRRRLAAGEGGTAIARDLGLNKLTVSKIKCGRTWTHVGQGEAA